MKPTISVLMPVYNAERYVAQAVQSILDQTFRDFEVLIIDDGSTDRSLEILKRYEASDPRIRLISRPNTGYVVALNEMLDLAHGEFIARMDADDVCLPDRFEKQLDWFERNPNGLATGSWVLVIDPEGDPLMVWRSPVNHKAIDDAHLSGVGGTIAHPSSMMRANALRRIDGYNVEMQPAEDLDLFLRLGEIGELGNVPEVLLKYRHHLSSVSHQNSRLQRCNADRAVNGARVRRGLSISEHKVRDEEPNLMAELIEVKWAWWALGAGNVANARKYAWRLVRIRPLDIRLWRLVFCCIRGY